MDLQAVVERFGGGVEEKRGEWVVHCPAHEDSDPSLRLAMGHTGVIVSCRAGCNTETVLAAVGLKLRDLFMDETKRIAATYSYTDEQGAEIFQALRYEPKDFRQRRSDGNGGWIWKVEGVRRVPYHLPQLLADKRRRVFVVEGEKDVHSLEAIGCVATTNAGGAGKWRKDHSVFLKGRAVTILPDNDDPGRNHANQVKAALDGIARSVQILELPGLPEKGDVSDWIASGGTADQLKALVDACNSPSTTPKESPNSSGTDSTAPSTPEKPLPTPSQDPPSVMEAKPEEMALLAALKLCGGKFSKAAAELLEKELRG